MKNIIIALIFNIFILNISFAEDSTKILELENKVSNLEYKLDLIQKSNDDYLGVVWTVVSLIGALFGGIIFLNWFQNFKLGKKEIESIKEDIRNDNRIYLGKIKDNIKDNINIEVNKKVKGELEDLKNDIYKVEHELFINKEVKFAYLFNNQLKKDLNNNVYLIDETLEKLEKFIKNKKLRTEEVIEIKDYLEKFIKSMEDSGNTFLEDNIITCKSIIKEYLGDQV